MLRRTVQRRIIQKSIEAFRGTHPTVFEISRAVRSRYSNISNSTVYRNLRGLHEEGIIAKINIPGESERYDLDITPHYHFRCSSCGEISDLFMEYKTDIDEEASRLYGHEAHEHQLVVVGICAKCKKI